MVASLCAQHRQWDSTER